MLVEVPAPPWMKSVTNWSRISPAISLSQAPAIASAILRVEHAQVAVRKRCRLLHVAERLDEVRLQRHRDAGDVEVLLAPQRLHAVVRVVGNLLLAEEVLLDAVGHHALLCLVARVLNARLRAYFFQPIATILRRRNAICVASGRSFGQTSWQASSDMQPNTPSSSPITS